MADIITVADEQDFVEYITADDDLDITADGARVIYEIWSDRYENGATDDYLVTVPGWFADKEFGKRRPAFFASIEYDEEDKGAVLFADIRMIDISIVENDVYDSVTITESLELLDLTDENEHIDEKGMDWVPRSLMTIYGR